jgi:FtsP/CotA-like multicopper oxidase with cupredoxin domain
MKPKPSRIPSSKPLAAFWQFGLAAILVSVAPGVCAAGIDLFSAQPHQFTSAAGELRADLVVEYADITLHGKKARLRTYNGRIPGPTFRAQPGETMFIRYINKLPPNHHSGGYVGSNSPHDFNTVNLHTHGLNVSPEGFSDNVLLEIEPGHWIPAQFDLPEDHPTGLFWYHPHKHGAVTVQLGSGMGGNIILEGKGDLNEIPEIKAAKTLEMVFHEIPLNAGDDHYEVPEHPLSSLFSDIIIYTVNGLPVFEEAEGPVPQPVLPEIRIRPGEVQRWQFTHAGLEKFLRLSITNNADGSTLPFHLVAYDGITLPDAETRSSVFLGPANRVEILVKVGAPGSYTLASVATPDEGAVDDAAWRTVRTAGIPLARMIAEGDPMDMGLPSKLNPPVQRLPDIQDIEVKVPGTQVTRQRVISFDVTLASRDNPTEGVRLTVNQRSFDGNRVDQTMLLNTAEEWTLMTDLAMAHPFHIHVNWFQVVAINDVPLPFPRWQDTVTIPQGGTVKIRHRFENFTGRFVFHCHILSHEDSGMMSLIEIIDPKNFIFGGLDTDDPEGDGYPNIFHEAFGFQPFFVAFGRTNPPPTGLPTFQFERSAPSDPPSAMTVTFDRRAGADSNVRYILETSNDLKMWRPVSAVPVGPADKKPGFETVTFQSQIPATALAADGQGFLRLRVERPDYRPLPIMPDMVPEQPGHGH